MERAGDEKLKMAKRSRWRSYQLFLLLGVLFLSVGSWFVFRPNSKSHDPEVDRLISAAHGPFLWKWREKLYFKAPRRLLPHLVNPGDVFQKRASALQGLEGRSVPLERLRPLVVRLFAEESLLQHRALDAFGKLAVEDRQIMRAWLESFSTNRPIPHLAGLTSAAEDAPFRVPIEARISPLTNSVDSRVRLLTAQVLERLDSKYVGLVSSAHLYLLDQTLTEDLPYPHVVATVYDIGELGVRGTNAIPRLIELKGHENEKIRRSATNALLKIQR